MGRIRHVQGQTNPREDWSSRGLLYGSQLLVARWDVAFGADGFDEVGVEAVLTPSRGGDIEQFVVVVVDAVRPAVATKVMPQVLDAVEFRGVWRQRD